MTHPRFNNSKAARAANELYPTPPDFTEALLSVWQPPLKIWEPASGNGDMVRVLRERGHDVTPTDLQTGQDFFTTQPTFEFDCIVTNPPFSLATEWAVRSLSLTPVVALLFPLYALGGGVRREQLWGPQPPTLVIVVPWRMRHETGTSHFNHMWIVWDGPSTTTTIEWAKEPKNA